MDSTHIHLLLNHFPVIGTLIGSGLLVWGIFRKQINLQISASVILALMAIVAIPVYLTGEPAEEAVEELPGVSEGLIEQHESAATLAIWIMIITGILALAAFIFNRMQKKQAGVLFIITAICSVLSFAAMARTGYYGGQIRHTEIRSGNATANGEANQENGEGEEDDEEEGGKTNAATDSLGKTPAATDSTGVKTPADKTRKDEDEEKEKDDDD
ncbi:MAG: hypothetical protein IPP73_04010 [Chitinophagaceae bacterium]|nr:hypothetical protein [Chitinophagaceae bacterium]